MKTRTLGLQMIVVGVFIQIPGCFPSCLIAGSIAFCAFKNLRSVPPLPPHITHLFLENNQISEINATSLSGLEKLQELDLGEQKVPLVIRTNAFSSQRRLRRLVLGSNPGLQLEQLAFAGLSSLQSLHLDYCSLNESILTESYLEPLSSLQTLDLYGNQIKRLQPSALFANMNDLTYLNLELNKIDEVCESDLVGFKGKHFTLFSLKGVYLRNMSNESFDWQKCGNPFRGISFQTLDLSSSVNTITQFAHNASSLSVQNNRLTDLGDVYIFFGQMRRLKLLFYGGNIIKWCTLSRRVSPFKGKVLDLHGNSLQSLWAQGKCLDLFDNFGSVTSLNLSSNGLHSLPRGIFEGLASVLKMDLSSNALVYLQPDVLPKSLETLYLSNNFIASPDPAAFRSLSFLDLSMNRFYCSADLKSFLTWLKQTKVKFLSPIQEFRCEFPAGLYKMPLLDYSAQLTQQ
ncbi:hypothetical protein GOODEAATRI_022724 [Goodea atripinnis]|uniref:Toll-like receptor 5 n=1 Tax=Goodea atripinnis TaxID=208336 RepID=A0ABV0N5V8_9TELE